MVVDAVPQPQYSGAAFNVQGSKMQLAPRSDSSRFASLPMPLVLHFFPLSCIFPYNLSPHNSAYTPSIVSLLTVHP
jgi:hypothetical protein